MLGGGFEFGSGLTKKFTGFSGSVYFRFGSRKSCSKSKTFERVRVESNFDKSRYNCRGKATDCCLCSNVLVDWSTLQFNIGGEQVPFELRATFWLYCILLFFFFRAVVLYSLILVFLVWGVVKSTSNGLVLEAKGWVGKRTSRGAYSSRRCVARGSSLRAAHIFCFVG